MQRAGEEAFDRLVSEGSDRLARPLVPLVATGLVGGIDVAAGVLAYLVVDHETGQPLQRSRPGLSRCWPAASCSQKTS